MTKIKVQDLTLAAREEGWAEGWEEGWRSGVEEAADLCGQIAELYEDDLKFAHASAARVCEGDLRNKLEEGPE